MSSSIMINPKKRKDNEKMEGSSNKTMRLHQGNTPPQLSTRIDKMTKTEFSVKSKDFFLPKLWQFDNSVKDIRTHYCLKGELSIAPHYLPDHLTRMKEKLLHLLRHKEKGLLTTGNILLPTNPKGATNISEEAFLFITHCLAVPLNIDISPLADGHICDILLISHNQPAIVLSIVEAKSTESKKYNVSIARGLTTSLNRFTDEDVSVVFGLLPISAMDAIDTFMSEVKQCAKLCSSFVTLDSLLMYEDKYNQILTAFWATVSQRATLALTQDDSDEKRVNFLTEQQCVVLIENINTKNALVMAHRNTGATTLMLDVARRFQNCGKTQLMFKSGTDIESYRHIGVNIAFLGDTDPRSIDADVETIIRETILPINIHLGHEMKRVWTFCSDFIKPKVLDDLVERLARYQFLIVIGSPGEGKSVLGMLLLHHYNSSGMRIKVLDSIEDLSEATRTSEDIIVLIDDVFGRLRCTFQLTREIEYAFDKLQTKLNVKVLFTSRTDVFKLAFPQLGKFQSQFEEENKFDLAQVVSEEEKREMLDKYLHDYNKNLDQDVKDKIIRQPASHGFPHSCQMFATMQSEEIDAVKFYENPLQHQVKKIENFLASKVNRALLYFLVANNGTFTKDMLSTPDDKNKEIMSYIYQEESPLFSQMQKASEEMKYIIQTDVHGLISFKHPSLLELTSHVIANDPDNIAFVIKFVPIELFEDSRNILDKGETQFSIHFEDSSHDFELLAGRFALEISKGNFQGCCQHPLLTNEHFVHSLVQQLDISKDFDEKMKLFYWSTSNSSANLITELMRKYDGILSPPLLHSAVVGSCRWGNVCALGYLVNDQNLKGNGIDEMTEDGLPCMIVAANQNHKQVLQSLISYGVDVNVVDSQMGGTALHWASAAGHLEVLDVLVEHIPVDTESIGGVPPLFVATENGHRSVVKFLIKKGANVNKQIRSRLISLSRKRNESLAMVRQLAVSDEGFTALHVASYEGHHEIVKDLLKLGADPTLCAKQGLAVDFAAQSKHVEIFKLFLDQPNMKMEDMLHAAYEHGQCDMISAALVHINSTATGTPIACLKGELTPRKFTLKEETETLTYGFTNLHFAALAGHKNIVHDLITESGDLINMQSQKGFTALHGAAITGQTDVVLHLIDKGADVNVQTKSGNSALHFASIHGHIDAVRLLTKNGAKIDMTGFRNRSPLHFASIHNKPSIVKYLVEQKANTEVITDDLATPLLFASYLDHKDIVDLLVDEGHAVINTVGRRSNPLVGVALMGSAESAQYLIQKGANVDHLSGLGVSALHAAVFMNSKEVVKCLIENDARVDIKMFEGLSEEEKAYATAFVSKWCKGTPGKDINLKRYDGGTPLHMATDMNNCEIVKLLLAAGASADIVNNENETPVSIAVEKGHSVIQKLLDSKSEKTKRGKCHVSGSQKSTGKL